MRTGSPAVYPPRAKHELRQRKQQKLSRKKKGSQNRQKARLAVAKVHTVSGGLPMIKAL